MRVFAVTSPINHKQQLRLHYFTEGKGLNHFLKATTLIFGLEARMNMATKLLLQMVFLRAAFISASCIDNIAWHHPRDHDITCQWISQSTMQREVYCTENRVHDACPQTCGDCCEDDSRFTFPDANQKSLDCDWLASSTEKDLYCNNDYIGTATPLTVREGCRETCNACFHPVPPLIGFDDDYQEEIMSDDLIVTGIEGTTPIPNPNKAVRAIILVLIIGTVATVFTLLMVYVTKNMKSRDGEVNVEDDEEEMDPRKMVEDIDINNSASNETIDSSESESVNSPSSPKPSIVKPVVVKDIREDLRPSSPIRSSTIREMSSRPFTNRINVGNMLDLGRDKGEGEEPVQLTEKKEPDDDTSENGALTILNDLVAVEGVLKRHSSNISDETPQINSSCPLSCFGASAIKKRKIQENAKLWKELDLPDIENAKARGAPLSPSSQSQGTDSMALSTDVSVTSSLEGEWIRFDKANGQQLEKTLESYERQEELSFLERQFLSNDESTMYTNFTTDSTNFTGSTNFTKDSSTNFSDNTQVEEGEQSRVIINGDI